MVRKRKVLEAYYKGDAEDFKKFLKEEHGKKDVTIRKRKNPNPHGSANIYSVYAHMK